MTWDEKALRQPAARPARKSWWLEKDREAFQAELKSQTPRMEGSRPEKVEGFQETYRTKGQMPE